MTILGVIIDTRLPSKTMSFCGSEVFRFLPAANPHFVPAARQRNVMVGGRAERAHVGNHDQPAAAIAAQQQDVLGAAPGIWRA